jgi:methylenetetrahydrofolate dehydrogenase (NADP+)/methenyltetrahydrofolate cyclohydrolase
MPAMILDGRVVARAMRSDTRQAAERVTMQRGRNPALAVLHPAGDAAARSYVRALARAAADVGITCRVVPLAAEATREHVLEQLVQLNHDPQIDGILVQTPLPADCDGAEVSRTIVATKDVDGISPWNAGELSHGRATLLPATPAGGMALLRHYQIPLAGRHAVVVGRSAVVGRPMALLLSHAHATVTLAHSRTTDLAALVRSADIVVSATGRAGIITGEMVRPGAVVVDFGINVLPDGTIVGDVDVAAVSAHAAAITPVPGGTGPMTTAVILQQVVDVAAGTA